MAWLDVAIARVRLGRWLSPWIATGALRLDGVRHPLGGPGRWRATSVAETPEGCRFELPGDDGLGLRGLGRRTGGSRAVALAQTPNWRTPRPRWGQATGVFHLPWRA